MMRLEVRDLSLQVLLGCTAGEQKAPQEVRASVFMTFDEPVVACRTDQLEDTVCYDKICISFKSLATSKSFQTIEHLCQLMTVEVKKLLPLGAQARVRVHKTHPPIEGLMGGSACELEISG